ncbi:maleylpyruvate isomerase N-terminal domain-containing protein [Mycolicibacterium pulveris]|uniref:maleylpyruvate isomerase N-terminal domain-containing protein n=1 Tax=Mycolicibacterium pulveris TaxID=36813 RepID=UPI003CED8BCB
MRLHGDAARQVLADAWERWAQRCSRLTAEEWATPTRCGGWDVAALLAHVCPEPAMFGRLAEAAVDPPAAVTDAALMLRRFNEPGGVATTNADSIAGNAVSDAAALTATAAARRFADSAVTLRAGTMPESTVIAYPVVGTTTLAVIVETALMEATVHLLDLAAAVGGVEPSPEALAATRDLLVAVPDATAAVEVLAGRAPFDTALPVIR